MSYFDRNVILGGNIWGKSTPGRIYFKLWFHKMLKYSIENEFLHSSFKFIYEEKQ